LVEIIKRNAGFYKLQAKLGHTEVVQIVTSSEIFEQYLNDIPKHGQAAALQKVPVHASRECKYGSTIGTPVPDPVLTKSELSTLANLLPPQYASQLKRISYFG
jgi:hypothetical protein